MQINNMKISYVVLIKLPTSVRKCIEMTILAELEYYEYDKSYTFISDARLAIYRRCQEMYSL